MTQEQLASAIGVTFQQVQKYELGTNRISASRLYDIARATGVDIMFFFEDMGDGDGRHGAPPLPPTDSLEDMTKSETLELIRLYWTIGSRSRKAVSGLVKAMAIQTEI